MVARPALVSRRRSENGCAGVRRLSRSDRRRQPAARPIAQMRGQYATYIAAQLRAYRAGTRQTDPNQMMRNVASTMTDEQIDAVASYIQGLR